MNKDASRKPLAWIDLLKGITLLWILLNHLSERFLGFPAIANPSDSWPPLGERLAQLRPLEGHGVGGLLLNLFRYVGWSGDQGVQVFLILSGFALTWGLLERQGGAPLSTREFYARRLARIFPLWWGAHLLFMLPWLLGGSGLNLGAKTFLSMAGLRCLPSLLYHFSPAWWFVGVLIQLYVVYPFLWRLLEKWGPLRFVVLCCAAGFLARALGLLHLGPLTDPWQRGICFITRLPEFAFGIGLAAAMRVAPEATDRRLRSASTLALTGLAYVAGTALSLTLLGMAVAPFLLGVGAFVLMFAACRGSAFVPSAGTGWISWIGRHSYSIYLVHHPVIFALIPQGGAEQGLTGNLVRAAAAVALSLVLAIVLERTVAPVSSAVSAGVRRLGFARAAVAGAALLAVVFGLLAGMEFLVRRKDPQEVNGWGERASLAPHPLFGYHLRPSQTTRLRWEGYDYRVTSNALGFPGPDVPEEKPASTLRIMTTGDAFTSAEGIDTELAWPRLLESRLSSRLSGRKVEVLNFAVTGYGPNQYAAVIRECAPKFRPDVILAEFFVNDFQDVMLSDEQYAAGIGFQLPPQGHWRHVVQLSHLRKWFRVHLAARVEAFLSGDPRELPGYSYGNFSSLEKHPPGFDEGRRRVAERLAEIKRVADGIGCRVVVAMVPSSVQVCDPDRLPYYPPNVNLKDDSRFDPELPQRTLRELTQSLSLGYCDLREALKPVPEDVYQPHNMHWLPRGHQAVAEFLAERLIRDGLLTRP